MKLVAFAALALAMSLRPAPALSTEPDRLAPTGAAATYANPVWAKDFPDPHILAHGGRFYAYGTETPGHRFQVMESKDLVHWTHRGTAFTVPWSNVHFWAPEVIRHGDLFYMTYSALNPKTDRHDIGIAVAKSPLGPFAHRAVLVRGDADPRQRVGVIDATIHQEGRAAWLVYTEEEPRRIVMRPLRPDLLAVEQGEAVELARPDREWERGCTEAPTLVKREGRYHLFYSGGWFQSSKRDVSYCVAHAVADRLAGPYVKTGPILQSVAGKVYGPGHASVVSLPSGETWLAYHAWDDQNEPRYRSNPLGRTLRLDRLTWRGGRPSVDGPSLDPRPAPRPKR